MAAAGCSDPPGASLAIQLHWPPPTDSTGHCPASVPPVPIPRGPTAECPPWGCPTTLRLTYRRAGGGGLLCDVVVPLEGASRLVGLPRGMGALPPLDLIVEAFRGDEFLGAVLVGAGEARQIDVAADAEVTVLVTPRDRFACSPGLIVQGRAFHTATTLPNGEIMLIGGVVPAPGDPGRLDVDLAKADPRGGILGGFYATSSVEVYDPRRGSFREITVPALLPRAFHAAFLLDNEGAGGYRIVLVGGLTVAGDPAATPVLDGIRDRPGQIMRIEPSGDATPAPTEILTYDPLGGVASRVQLSTGAFQPRIFPAVTRAPSRGDDPAATPQVPPIVAGGYKTFGGEAAPTFERADLVTGYSETMDTWRVTPDVRVGASITRLDGDRALVWGGTLAPTMPGAEAAEAGNLLSGLAGDTPSSALVPFDPAAPDPPSPRAFHTATPIGGGRVLVVGGFGVSGGSTGEPASPFAQIVDVPAGGGGGTITNVVVPDAITVGYHDATPLLGGDVLVTGGNPAGGTMTAPCPDGTDDSHLCSVRNAYRWRAASGTLEHLLATPMLLDRWGHRTAVLLDGTVLVTGGFRYVDAQGRLYVLRDAELYNPRTEAMDPAAADLGADLPPRAPGDIARYPDGTPFSECPVVEP